MEEQQAMASLAEEEPCSVEVPGQAAAGAGREEQVDSTEKCCDSVLPAAAVEEALRLGVEE